jgi:uncharacterized repeat protein (TIGR01451 family)
MHAEEDQVGDAERRGTPERSAWFAMSGTGFGLLDFLTATQTAVDDNGGRLGPGDTISYVVTIRNRQADFAQLDNAAPEAIIALPPNTSLVAGSMGASVGSLTENTGSGQLEWNGVVVPGGTVVLSYQLRVDIAQSVCGRIISSQAELWMDANRDGQNSIRELSDDVAASDGVDRDADGFLNDDDANRMLVICQPPSLDLDADDSSGAPGNEYRDTFAGTPVPIADGDVTITDTDSANMQGAVVEILGGQSGDRLVLAGPLPSGIVAMFSSQNQLLTLSGTVALGDYQTALTLVRFDSTATSPTGLRLIRVLIRDHLSFLSNNAISRISLDVPQLSIEQTNSPTTASPGDVINYRIEVRNVGTVLSANVVVTDEISPYCMLGLNTFGVGQPFRYVDSGTGLVLGPTDFSDSGGFGYLPTSGAGRAPAGYDALVENWRITMNGSMPTGYVGFVIEYACMVE